MIRTSPNAPVVWIHRRRTPDPAPDIRRVDAELLAAEIRGARISMGMLGTAALRSR